MRQKKHLMNPTAAVWVLDSHKTSYFFYEEIIVHLHPKSFHCVAFYGCTGPRWTFFFKEGILAQKKRKTLHYGAKNGALCHTLRLIITPNSFSWSSAETHSLSSSFTVDQSPLIGGTNVFVSWWFLMVDGWHKKWSYIGLSPLPR